MLYRLARDVSSCKLELSVGREPRMASVWRSCHRRTDLAHHKTSDGEEPPHLSKSSVEFNEFITDRCNLPDPYEWDQATLLQDMSEPIRKVAERYNEDGWCVFGAAGTWASNCAVTRRKRDTNVFINTWLGFYWHVYWCFLFSRVAFRKRLSNCQICHDGMMRFFDLYKRTLNGVVKNDEYTLTLSDGRSLSIRDHQYPLDDLYCWVNGWYSLPRASVIQNYSYLEEVSDRSCKNLEQIPGCA